MARVVVVLSGSVSAGKTTLAKRLVDDYGAVHYRTRLLLKSRAKGKVASERTAMQRFGEQLDRETNGSWIADDLVPQINRLAADAVVLIDAVRIAEQIRALRAGLPRQVVHVHLDAPRAELERRYRRRRKSGFAETSSYTELLKNETERQVPMLAHDADVVIDTALSTKRDVEVRAAAYLGLSARDPGALVDVIIGGQYGSEGKGNIAFAIGSDYDMLCRVGGPNAGHKVPLDDGPFTHRLLPSATMTSEVPILIGPGAVLNTDVLFDEIAKCQLEFDRLRIDPQAMIIEKDDQNSEASLVKEIGSTGQVQSPGAKGKTSGPMGQTTSWAEIARRSKIPVRELRNSEKGSVSKKQRRVGEFDWELLHRAAQLNGATDIALTFVDYLNVKNRDARRFDQLQPDTIRFIEEIERVACAPVSLISTRFHVRSVIDRRAW